MKQETVWRLIIYIYVLFVKSCDVNDKPIKHECKNDDVVMCVSALMYADMCVCKQTEALFTQECADLSDLQCPQR